MSSIIPKNFQNIFVTNITPVSTTSATYISATNITATNLVVTAATIPNIILTGSLNANYNSNTMANIYTTGGNVGINTTSPTFTLDVNGQIRTYNSNPSTGVNDMIRIGQSESINNIALIDYNYTTIGSSLNSLGLGFFGANNKLVVQASGNVGINNTSPIYTLDINGISRISTRLDIGGTQPSFNSNTIGQLFLTGTANTSNGPHLLMNTSQDKYPTFHLLNYSHDNISLNFDIYYDGSFRSSTNTTSFQIYKINSQLQFNYANGTTGLNPTAGTAMVIASTGNVGINNNTPQFTLDISGTTRISNSLTTGSIYSTNITSSNIVGTNVTVINLISTNLTSSNIFASNTLSAANATLTSATISTLAATNISSSNMTIGSILATTQISSSALFSTNITTVNLVSTNNTITNLVTTFNTFANTISSAQTTGTLTITTSASLIGNTNTIGSIFTTGGNVGVGTVSPAFTLDINGSLRVSSLFVNASSIIAIGGTTTLSTAANTNQFVVGTSGHTILLPNSLGLAIGAEYYIANQSTQTITVGNNLTNVLNILNPGCSQFFTLTSNTGAGGFWASLGGNLLNGSTGNIGLNTTNPGTSLDIIGNSRVLGMNYIGNPNNTADNLGTFIDSNNNGLGYRLGIIKKTGLAPFFATNNNNSFVFSAANNTDASQITTNSYTTIMTLSTTGTLTLPIGGLNIPFNSNTLGNIFTTGGNLGINTTSPAFALDIRNTNLSSVTSTNISQNIFIGGNYGQTGTFIGYFGGQIQGGTNINQNTYLALGTNNNGTFVERIRAVDNGFVGINTTSPSFTLDVAGTGRFTGAITQVGGGRDTSFVATATGTGQAGIALDSTAGGGNRYNIYSDPATKQLQFFNVTTTNSSLNLDSRGNFGIGVTNPQFTLDVSGSLRAVALNSAQFSPPHTLINTGTSQPSVVSLLAPNVSSGNYVTTMFGQSLSNGNCGQLSFGYNGSNNSANNISLSMYGGGAASFISLNNNGNMGINTTTPLYPLHVVGSSIGFVTGGYYFYANSGTALIQWSTSNQAIGIFATSAILTQNNFLASSDLRIKNICDEKINLNLIDLINPLIYTYKDKIKNPKKNIGFIAQNVFEHCPEAVTLHKGVIPDIMKLIDIIENKDTIITIKNEWQLKEKDIIKIIIDDKDTAGELITIIYSDKDIVKFKHLKLKQKVFVYGRQVDDFHELNYDYIFALGFAGIQKSRKEIKELIKDNILLKQNNISLRQDIDNLTEFIKSKFQDKF